MKHDQLQVKGHPLPVNGQKRDFTKNATSSTNYTARWWHLGTCISYTQCLKVIVQNWGQRSLRGYFRYMTKYPKMLLLSQIYMVQQCYLVIRTNSWWHKCHVTNSRSKVMERSLWPKMLFPVIFTKTATPVNSKMTSLDTCISLEVKGHTKVIMADVIFCSVTKNAKSFHKL